ncbi:MAG: hypothetical protein COA96_15735 [SAR86 cluster bacterium]|uniref:Uncharacterized protein n=1 Tax=SAR86 cluster bacterium TaxID=2030880 RepID=A0A2A5AND2_9GAMM|nr:MAG: hypothetical protein COA96_15735 [SAR86 cluster bacterium]
MPNYQSDESALQWFFRKPSASNFPQDTSSPVLRQLSSSAEKFSKSLLDNRTNIPDLAEHSLYFSRWVGKVDSSKNVNKEDLNDLVVEIGDVLTLIQRANPNDISQNIRDNLNGTIVALAMLAKSSQDTEFSKDVVSLAGKLPSSSNPS